MFNTHQFMMPITPDDPDGYGLIPEHTLYSLRMYIAEGQPLGGFLEKVVSGDATRASTDADLENKRGFHAICRWIAVRAPMCCYGSAFKYDLWLTIGGLKHYAEYDAARMGRASDLDPEIIERLRRLHADYAKKFREQAQEHTDWQMQLGMSKTAVPEVAHGR